jgi:hypothetical protein
MVSCNGGKSMLPLVKPRQNFFILDSLSGLKIEQIDFTKRVAGSEQAASNQVEKGQPLPSVESQKIRTLTNLVWYGLGLQMITNDSMGGFQFAGTLPKAAFDNMKMALEREAGRPTPKL